MRIVRSIVLSVFILLCGCSTSYYSVKTSGYSKDNFVSIDSFCKSNKLQYSFDTIDDMVRLHSDDKEIRMLLNSRLGYFNGSIFNVKSAPFYSKGTIFIPRKLQEIISVSKISDFKPVYNIKTIVIDPGHGGKDPGAVSPTGFYEKTVNMKVAQYLKKDLEKKGFKVILTRYKDVYLTLQQRVDVAKNHDADLFISIHANSNRSRYVSGIEVYYLSPSRLNSQQRAVKLAKTGTIWPKKVPFDARVILWDMLLTKNYGLSVECAHNLYFTFKKLGFKVKPPRQAPFYVLRYAYVPSVLVEIGYLSNKYEEKILRKTYYQKQIADTIASSVVSLNSRYTQVVKDKE